MVRPASRQWEMPTLASSCSREAKSLQPQPHDRKWGTSSLSTHKGVVRITQDNSRESTSRGTNLSSECIRIKGFNKSQCCLGPAWGGAGQGWGAAGSGLTGRVGQASGIS